MRGFSTARRASALRAVGMIFVAIFFLVAQGAHAVAATYRVCHFQAAVPEATHKCGQGQHDSGKGGQGRSGCCCGDCASCGCEMNQGRSAERQELPAATAIYWSGHAQADAGAASSQIAVFPHLVGKNPCMIGIQARAPSENASLSTVKLLC